MTKAIAAILSVFSFVFYQYELVVNGVKLNELYFIASAFAIAVFACLSIKKSDSILVTSFVLLAVSFFTMAPTIYIYRWVIFGDGSTNYFTALSISASLTFVYTICHSIYYVFKHYKPLAGHK